MSSIEQLGTDRWRARWRDPGGRQKAKTFTHKDFADHYLRNIDAAIQTRTYVDPSLGNVKVKDFAAKWMTAQGHLKPSTRATYERLDVGARVYSVCTQCVLMRRSCHRQQKAQVVDLRFLRSRLSESNR